MHPSSPVCMEGTPLLELSCAASQLHPGRDVESAALTSELRSSNVRHEYSKQWFTAAPRTHKLHEKVGNMRLDDITQSFQP